VTVRFLQTAEFELDDAIRWYESQSPGLGNTFLIEVLAATDRIVRYPEAWQPLDADARRYRLGRCPYALIYAVESGDILVLAVAHLHRKPDYWRDRLQHKS
jgi:plasmid stabilization system protein ParE